MKFLLIIFTLFSTFCFSQKNYEFDYLFEYELTFYKDSIKVKNRSFYEKNKTIKRYYLTNSKSNDYKAFITEIDSLKNHLTFIDKNGILSNVTFLKADFDKAEFIDIDCKNVLKHSNSPKFKNKNWSFLKVNDTLIKGKTYSKFKMESIKPKRTKRKKLGVMYYIIDTESSFHLPFMNFTTTYEGSKNGGILPNGIFFESYFIDYYGDLKAKEKLIKYWKIDKKITINHECDYTKKN